MSIAETDDRRKPRPDTDVGEGDRENGDGKLRVWGGEGNRNEQITFRQLLDLLGYQQDEFVSVCHKIGSDGKFMTAVVEPQEAATVVESLPPEADVWFGVNPTCGPVGRVGRGTAAQVTRHAALYADLDVEPGKCPTFEVAHAIVDDLSAILGERPSVVVNSGHGLHPYWPIDRESAAALSNGDSDALMDGFGHLVRSVAGHHDCKVDPVFDLARVLRVPGTTNHKELDHPVEADRKSVV